MAKAKSVELKPIQRRIVTVRLVGVSPLIQHRWAEKAKRLIREKQQEGKKTKNRDLRDPKQEVKDATYWCDEKETIPGVPAVAIKTAVIEAAHNDLGYPRTLLRKAMFIFPMGREIVLPLESASGNGKASTKAKKEAPPEGVLTEDMVRVGQGSTDMRYRPYFYDWAVTTKWEVDSELLQVEDLVTLLDRAGFGVGIQEWRPQKGGEFGRFRVDPDFKIVDSPA